MSTAVHSGPADGSNGRLNRSVGFYGLMFVSLGSIIGSGWLLAALTAAQTAGPASIISWLLAAAMLATLALVYAELGATYPVAGASGRFPAYAHGPVAGFVGGWSAWLQAVFTAPIEVLAAITYVNSIGWTHRHFPMLGRDGLLTARGLVVAVALMLVFTGLNLAGAAFMADSNVVVVIWKTAVPLLAIGVIASLSFHPGNFTAGGGFLPFGAHGIFAALPAGVVFALTGFEQAVALAGEARNPRRDLSRSILVAMGIGALLYALLQVAMIAGLNPVDIATGWSRPLGQDPSDYGAWYTLAIAVGATWLAVLIVVDAVISPSGTGVVYMGTAARLSYALGEGGELPRALTSTNRKGVPVVSILVALVVGLLALGPFKSWGELVGAATGANAVMYAMAPIALAALQKSDPDRPRSYRVPMPRLVLPTAFVSANLILYWGGIDTNLKVVLALAAGVVVFAIGSRRAGTGTAASVRHAIWVPVWLAGCLLIGYLGRYGSTYSSGPLEGHLKTAREVLPSWVDLIVVIGFSLAVFHWAVSLRLAQQEAQAEIERDSFQLESATG
jgi:amino acid transporter